MLAYVFWHRPRDAADVATYETDLRSFHDALELTSRPFRLERLPFGTGGGYEDWYLVEDWSALGALNEVAVDARHRLSHDRVAERAADGWGGVYELLRGEARVPEGTDWLDKPRGESTEEFVSSLPHPDVWRRLLVLGPAPEFCGGAAKSATRTRI